jgi:hypothetical protein
VRQDLDRPVGAALGAAAVAFGDPAGGSFPVASWKLCRASPICFRLLDTTCGRRLAHLLHGGRAEPDQDGDDGDDDEQLDEREPAARADPDAGEKHRDLQNVREQEMTPQRECVGRTGTRGRVPRDRFIKF